MGREVYITKSIIYRVEHPKSMGLVCRWCTVGGGDYQDRRASVVIGRSDSGVNDSSRRGENRKYRVMSSQVVYRHVGCE